MFARIKQIAGQEHIDPLQTEIGSMVYAVKPGDGSAREQAASCQRVIGGLANIAEEYATKRYRSNVINWGMLPLQMAEAPTFEVGITFTSLALKQRWIIRVRRLKVM